MSFKYKLVGLKIFPGKDASEDGGSDSEADCDQRSGNFPLCPVKDVHLVNFVHDVPGLGAGGGEAPRPAGHSLGLATSGEGQRGPL